MFIANQKALLLRRGSTDIYGTAEYMPAVEIRVGVIRLQESSMKTTVRADSSASRGSAMEETTISRILVPAKTVVEQGDEIRIQGFALTVQSIWPRYNIAGRLDHWQLDLTINAARANGS
jgi:hypothetical protein